MWQCDFGEEVSSRSNDNYLFHDDDSELFLIIAGLAHAQTLALLLVFTSLHKQSEWIRY